MLFPTNSHSSSVCPGGIRFNNHHQQHILYDSTPSLPSSYSLKLYCIWGFFNSFESHHLSTYQLLTIVVALDNTIIRDANWHHQDVSDGPGAQCVYHDGQHACTRCRRLTAAGAGTLKVDLQKLLLTQQLLCILQKMDKTQRKKLD